jgi:catechol 2,3-dioxygenase-like lactoylglutathione lyase family enzyme
MSPLTKQRGLELSIPAERRDIVLRQFISAVSLLVGDYDEAISWYTEVLGFALVEDSDLGSGKRWILVAPSGSPEMRLLLAKAQGEAQIAAIGNQSGGRVLLFLTTDDFARDHRAMVARGVKFLEDPRHEDYGIVAVFEDVYGNKWDLLQPA